MNKTNVKIYNWLNMFALTAMVAVNALANILPLGGNTSGQVSDRYPSLFTPSGTTFAIWGVIYAFLMVVFIRQLISRKSELKVITQNMSGLFASSCALNIGWIFCWHFRQVTGATLIIFVLLINLIVLMTIVKYDKLMSMALGIYTAWIIVASVASIFVQAAYNGADLVSVSGETYAMIAVIIAGTVLTLIGIMSRNWTFMAVGIWSFAGIVNKHVAAYRSEYILVMGAALLMIVVMLLGLAYLLYTGLTKQEGKIRSIIGEKSSEVLPG